MLKVTATENKICLASNDQSGVNISASKNHIKDKKACLPTSLFIIQKHYEIIYFANKIII